MSTPLPHAVPPAGAPEPFALPFRNTYARLGEAFSARVDPTPVRAPQLLALNRQLALDLALDPEALASPEGVEVLAGNRVAAGSEPLAMAYAGHQFGHFVPQLGDGRANLLGEVVALNGRRYDLQLKGAGPTPFSRRGDGRAALGPVLREYIVSEAMAALGVPTTRALAAVATGERLLRDEVVPGAVLTRVAASHLRVGTFQFFAARGDTDSLRQLAEYALERHYPEILAGTAPGDQNAVPKPYRALLDGVITRHARLVAQWLLLGFVHGVMNTDNTSISGETIDYGPCAFMEAFDRETVFSSIDRGGRYAYGNQPVAAHWNLARFAETLLPLLETEEGSADAALGSAAEALAAFEPQFDAAYGTGLARKLGLLEAREGDLALGEDLLARMAEGGADFTATFRGLCAEAVAADGNGPVRPLFHDPELWDGWVGGWRRRLAEQTGGAEAAAAAMRLVNPVFIPRNHLVEEAIVAAVGDADLRPFSTLLDVATRPFEERPGLERYTLPAAPGQRVLKTFCGT